MTSSLKNATIFLHFSKQKRGVFFAMMYIHFCKKCLRLHMLNGHKIACPACQNNLTELKFSYLTYVEMSDTERTLLLEQLKTDDGIKRFSTTYRMQKYNKSFKN